MKCWKGPIIQRSTPHRASCARPEAKWSGWSIHPSHSRFTHSDEKKVHMIGLVPSILSADFTRLGEQVREAEAGGAQRIQIDVMDGHFVPNITMGPGIVEATRRSTSLPLEAHLMITNPEQYIEDFASAGADVIIIHQ